MIRALPVPVRPVDGETSESYFGRLATANSLPTETLWGYLRQLHGGLPIKRNAELATYELEVLVGMPALWFSRNRQHHLLPIRCPHTRWEFATCAICSGLPAPHMRVPALWPRARNPGGHPHRPHLSPAQTLAL